MSQNNVHLLSLLLTTICLVSQNCVSVNASHHHNTAPSPAVDCSAVVLNMVDCLSYVSKGSRVSKPEGSCCVGLKSVLKSSPLCLCEAFKNSAQFGVALNVTKALGLPSACKLSAPSLSNCGVSIGGAPAQSPVATTPSSISNAPTMSIAANDFAPAPAPGSSASSALALSVSSLVLSLVYASFSLF